MQIQIQNSIHRKTELITLDRAEYDSMLYRKEFLGDRVDKFINDFLAANLE